MAGLGVSDITFWDGELDRYQGKTVETMIDACDLAISADGKLIAGAGRDGRLRMFQVDPQQVAAPRKGIIKSTRLVLPAHDARITSITFTDVGSVATASEDGLIKLWRFRRPAYRSQRIPTQQGHACFTDTLDGCLVFFRDGSLALWDALTEALQWRLGTEHDNVQMIEIAADGSHFVCVDDRHTARVWTTSTKELVATFDHPARIMITALSPDGRYLALTGVDGFTKVWDIQANREAYVCNLDDWGLATQFSPDGTRLVLGGEFNEIILVKTDTWEVESRLSCRNRTQVVSFDESGNRLATAHNNKVHVWDLGLKQRILTLNVQEFEKIRSMAFHPDGETLAIGGNYPVVDLWHLPTERRLGTAMRFRDSDIAFARQLAFDPSGRSLRAVVYKERLGARYFTTLSTSYSPIESDGQHNSHR